MLLLSLLHNGPTISQAQSNISRETAQGKDLGVMGKARWQEHVLGFLTFLSLNGWELKWRSKTQGPLPGSQRIISSNEVLPRKGSTASQNSTDSWRSSVQTHERWWGLFHIQRVTIANVKRSPYQVKKAPGARERLCIKGVNCSCRRFLLGSQQLHRVAHSCNSSFREPNILSWPLVTPIPLPTLKHI